MHAVVLGAWLADMMLDMEEFAVIIVLCGTVRAALRRDQNILAVCDASLLEFVPHTFPLSPATAQPRSTA